jgi:hypothetical protein
MRLWWGGVALWGWKCHYGLFWLVSCLLHKDASMMQLRDGQRQGL